MKNIITKLFIIGILLLSCELKAQQIKTDLQRDYLKGKVKMCAEYSYNVADSSGFKKGMFNQVITRYYNEAGNCIKEVQDDDSIVGTHGITYFKFDANGRCIEMDAETRTEQQQLGIKEESASKVLYKYDSLGFLIEYNSYVADTFAGKTIYVNDNKGNHLEESSYNAGNKLVVKFTAKFDSLGNENENEVYFDDLVQADKWMTKYDKDGNPVEINSFSKVSGKKRHETYTYLNYDKNNNWLLEHQYIDGKPAIIIERKIEYY